MTTTIEKPMQKCHSIIVTGKVQDIGFRSVVDHIGNIDLPEEFSRVSSDDEIDIGRKLDKGNEFLKNLPDIKDMLGSFIGEQKEHNTRLEAILEKLVNKS